MPVFKLAAGGQHRGVLGVDRLVGRQGGGQREAGAAARGREAIAKHHVQPRRVLCGARICHRAFALQPCPVDVRQRSHALPHFGEDIARMGVLPVEPEATRDLLRDPPVGLCLAGQRHGGAAHLHLSVGVGDGAVFFGPRRGRQDHIGELRRFGDEDVLHYQVFEPGERGTCMIEIGVGHGRVLTHDVHTANAAGENGVHDLDHCQAGILGQRRVPQFFESGTQLRVTNALVVGQHHRDQARVGRALHVVLAT